ncbi:MAG: beta strand repeat-containing protein [Marmoricola sp.]
MSSSARRILVPLTALLTVLAGASILTAAPASAVTVTILTSTAGPGSSVAHNATVTIGMNLAIGSGGGPLAGKTVTGTIGTQTCTAQTNANGDASCSITLNQAPGATSYSIHFTGDSTYLSGQCPNFGPSSSCSRAITISRVSTTVTYTGPTTMVAGGFATVGGHLDSAEGAVANQLVRFVNSGSGCTDTTDANGDWSCGIATPAAGPMTYAVRFNNPETTTFYSSSETSGTISVTRRTPTLTYTGDTAGVTGQTVTLSGTVKDGTSGLPGNPTVTFALGGQSCQAAASSSGAATCTIVLNQTVGTKTLTMSVGASVDYLAASTTASFTIGAASTVLTWSGSTTGTATTPQTLAATLTTAAGAPIAGEPVDFGLTSGGYLCSGTTNAAGVATCQYSFPAAGQISVSAGYGAANQYDGSSTSAVLSIAKRATTVLYLGQTTVPASGQITLSGLLRNDGTFALGGKPVTFTFGTQSCTGTTSANGSASCVLTVTQAPGTKSITMAFTADATYSSSTTSSSATVTAPLTTQVLDLGPTTATTGSSVTLTGKFLSGSVPLAAKTVVLSIGTQQCSATTGPDGVGTCDVLLTQPAGTVTLLGSYTADGVVSLSGSGSIQATLTKSMTTTAFTTPGSPSAKVGVPLVVEARVITLTGASLLGEKLTFTLGSASCEGEFAMTNTTSCTLTPTAAGATTLTATFAGTSMLAGSSDSIAVDVAAATKLTTSTYTGPTSGTVGETVVLSGTLTSDGSPLPGKTVHLGVFPTECTAVTDATGAASCSIQVVPSTDTHQGVGMIFFPEGEYDGSSDGHPFTTNRQLTTTTYTGPTTVTAGTSFTAAASVSAALPVSGGPLLLAISDDATSTIASSCSTTVGSNGTGSCLLTAPASGPAHVLVNYGGDATFQGNVGLTAVVVAKNPTTTTYLAGGSVPIGDAATLTATLFASSIPVSGKALTFGLDDQTCTGTTDVNGVASCTITPTQRGVLPVTVSYAGDDFLATSQDAGNLTVTKRPSTVSYTGPITAGAGATVSLSGTVTSGGSGLAGRTLTLGLGTQSCTGTTDATGAVACSVTLTQTPATVEATATFAGDSTYAAGSDTEPFTITKLATVATYTGPASIVTTGAVTLTGTLKAGGAALLGKSVQLSVGTQSCTATTDASGTASCAVSVSQAPGTVAAGIVFAGDATFLSSSDSAGFTIDKLASTATYTGPVAATATNAVTLTGTLRRGADPLAGKAVVLAVGTQTCATTTDAAGGASCSVTLAQTPGTTTASITFAGDATYLADEDSSTFTIAKAATTATYTGPTSVVTTGTVTLTGTLKSGAAGLAGKQVTLTIGTQSCTDTTGATGSASCAVTVGQVPGSATASISFAGDATYLASSDSHAFTIDKLSSTAAYTGPVSATPGDSVNLTGTLTSGGAPLAGRSVTLALGTQSCTATTGAGGSAGCSVTLSQAPGASSAGMTFAGDATYLSSTDSMPFTINKIPTSTAYTGVLTGAPGTGVTVTGSLSAAGAPVIGGQVTFALGTQSCSATTDASGTATCTITVNQALGSKTLTTSYAGSSRFLPSSDTDTFDLQRLPTTAAYTGPTSAVTTGTVALTGTLRNGSTGLAGKPVTLALGTQSCSASTNASGTATCSVTISQTPGTVDAVITFAGDVTYLGSTATAPFSIDKLASTATYTGPSTVVTGNAVTLTGTLKKGTTALVGKAVSFTLGNQTCAATTTSTGTGSCTITVTGLPGSVTTVAMTFTGDGTYLAASDSKPFTISKRVPTIAVTGPTSGVVGQPVTLSGTLKDGTTALPGRVLALTLGNQYCLATTTSTGAASCTLTISQVPTTTTTGAGFGGDATYGTASVTKAFVINKAPTVLVAHTAITGTSQPKVSANLTSYGVPVGGQTVSFRTTSGLAICSAVTDGTGYVTCAGGPGALKALLGGGYTATFAGNAFFLGSTAKGQA